MWFKIFISAFFIFLTIGCDNQTITDPYTQESPKKVEQQQKFILVENNNDGMSRRNLEYDSQEVGKLVVDPNYYKQHKFQRGEVIYYKMPSIDMSKYLRITPPIYNVSRVIALPGEVVQIKKGRIYVNGKKLNTFYGKALSWGMDAEEYFKQINQPGKAECNESCQKTMMDYFNMDMERFEVSDDYLFVMGDTWWRSTDSQIFGPLPFNNVNGKVLGYEIENK